MTVIELGDITPGSAAVPDQAREFDRRIARRLALVAVAGLTLLGATASARPQPRLIQTLWTIPFGPGDRYAVSDRTLYATTMDTAGRLTAYDLSDGRARWSIPMPEPTGYPNVAKAAGAVLLPADRAAVQVKSGDGSYLSETFRGTVAIDERTGTERWRRPGDVYTIADDTALLVDWAAEGNVITGLRMVRLADGAIVWSRPPLGRARITVAGADGRHPRFLISIRPDGAAQVTRWADGATLANATIDWIQGSSFDGEFSDLGADDRNVYVRLSDGQGSSLTAYALETLERRWRVVNAARVSAYPCGRAVCSIENDGFAVYDPMTGATRWRMAGVQNAWAVAGGRLLAADGAQDAYTLLDDVTGERIATLGLGTPVQDDDGRALLVMRSTLDPPGRTAVSRVDLATGRMALRGTIDMITDFGCSIPAGRLVCPNGVGQLVVSAVG